MISKMLAVVTATAAAGLGVPAIASAQDPCVTQGSAGLAYATGVNCRTLQLDGHQRHYIVYVPSTAPVTGPRAPVVFMFHGSSGDGAQFLKMSGWREQADATGLIAVFPTGQRYRILETGRLETKWNDFNLLEDIDAVETPPADDVGFVDAMLDDLGTQLPIDGHRVYASGFSNGAGFAARLAVDRAETFAAVAFSGGGLPSPQAPTRPVPTYSTVGTLDDRVLAQTSFTELPLDPVAILTDPVLDGYLNIALQTLGLDASQYGVLAQPHSTNFRWPATGSGPGGALLRFAMLDGLVHRYPNGTNNPNGFAAAPEFWDFFRTQRLP